MRSRFPWLRCVKSVLSTVMPLLLTPADIDSRTNNIRKVARVDTSNEKDSIVVLNGYEFRVVDPGFLVKLLCPLGQLNSSRLETKFGLSMKPERAVPNLVNDSVFLCLHSPFGTGSMTIRQDWTGVDVSPELACLLNFKSRHLHASTMAFITRDDYEAAKTVMEFLSLFIHI